MNLTLVIIVAILAICLILYTKYSNSKEHFAVNPIGAMQEQWEFGNNQYLLHRDTSNKELPINKGIDLSDNLNRALNQPDMDVATSPDRDFTGFFATDSIEKYRTKDAFCKKITRPVDFPARTSDPVQCGWWFISDSSFASSPAAGTPDAPLFPEQLLPNGTWIWNVEEAQMLEEMKKCNDLKSCTNLELTAFKGVCGWCDASSTGVPILNNGKEKYPDSKIACGSPVLSDSNKCKKPMPIVIADDGTLCGIYGKPSADNLRREYTKDECDALMGQFLANGDCVTASGTTLNASCAKLNEPLASLRIVSTPSGSVTSAILSKKTPDGTLLPNSQLGLFGGAIVRSDQSQYSPGSTTLEDACTLNSAGKLPIACIQTQAEKLGFAPEGAIMRILSNPNSVFTETEDMAMSVLLREGLVFPPGGLLNSKNTKSVGDFLYDIKAKMVSGSSQLARSAASIFVNGDSSQFDPCNEANMSIILANSGTPLPMTLPCLQRAFRKAGCQASGAAYPKASTLSTYSSSTLGSIQLAFKSLYDNLQSTNANIQDSAVKNCMGIQYSRDASRPTEYIEQANSSISESIASYNEPPSVCAQKCSEDPTCLSYEYNDDGSFCKTNFRRTGYNQKPGTTLQMKNENYFNGQNVAYRGCYKDSPQHLLPTKGPGIVDGNLDACIKFGKKNELPIMGLQNNTDCYFGSETSPFKNLGAGNPSECRRFGGASTNQVYSIPLSPPILSNSGTQAVQMAYKGCFGESPDRALPNLQKDGINPMKSGNDVGECAYLTRQAGDNVFGISKGVCASGKNVEYDRHGERQNCPAGGGDWANQVYTLPGYTPPPKLPSSVSYKGCFNDTGDRAVETYRGDVSFKGSGNDGKVECMNKAIQNGDNVFALQCSGPPSSNCNRAGIAQCFTGKNSTYDKYGTNSSCGPLGGGWTNQVHTISGYAKPDLSKLPTNPMIKKGNKIAILAGTTKNYVLSFDITPKGINGGWSNIIRFTYDETNDCCNPGARSPSIWFVPGGTSLHCRIGDIKDGNWGIDTAALPMNLPSNVVITCKDNNPTVVVSTLGTFSGRQPNSRVDPAGRSLVVYASDRFWPAANATIANLSYTTF